MEKDRQPPGENAQGFRPDAVIFATSPDGKKFPGMQGNLTKEWGDIRTAAASPNDIPEELYHDVYTDPGAVAAAKVLQVASRYPDVLGDCFPIFVANDVQLLTPKYNGLQTWEIHNKPPKESTDTEIFEKLYALLNPPTCPNHGYCEAKFLFGGAAYDPQSKRGLFGSRETYFWFTRFSEEEVKQYIEKYSGKLRTNGSCRWEEDPFDKHLIMINNAMADTDDFIREKIIFHNAVQGGLPGIGSLVSQTADFTRRNVLGDNTHVMTRLNTDFLHYPTSGVWGRWRG